MRILTTTDLILRAFDNNPDATNDEIAAQCGTYSSLVRAALSRHRRNVRPRPAKQEKPARTTRVRLYRRVQDWEEQAIVDALKAGEKLEALAAEFARCTSVIWSIGYRNGVCPRRAA